MFRNALFLVLLVLSCLCLAYSSPMEPSEFRWLRSKRQLWRYGGFGMPNGAGSTWENYGSGGVSLFGRK